MNGKFLYYGRSKTGRNSAGAVGALEMRAGYPAVASRGVKIRTRACVGSNGNDAHGLSQNFLLQVVYIAPCVFVGGHNGA